MEKNRILSFAMSQKLLNSDLKPVSGGIGGFGSGGVNCDPKTGRVTPSYDPR